MLASNKWGLRKQGCMQGTLTACIPAQRLQSMVSDVILALYIILFKQQGGSLLPSLDSIAAVSFHRKSAGHSLTPCTYRVNVMASVSGKGKIKFPPRALHESSAFQCRLERSITDVCLSFQWQTRLCLYAKLKVRHFSVRSRYSYSKASATNDLVLV